MKFYLKTDWVHSEELEDIIRGGELTVVGDVKIYWALNGIYPQKLSSHELTKVAEVVLSQPWAAAHMTSGPCPAQPEYDLPVVVVQSDNHMVFIDHHTVYGPFTV